MNSIATQLDEVKATLPKDVSLVAVSKYHPVEALLEAYQAGQRIFGESRVQELLPKVEQCPSDIEWHFIGNLQRNKVKYIVPFIHTIHSVDKQSLLAEIDKRAAKEETRNDKIKIFLQVHVAQEETKSGFSPEELLDFVQTKPWDKYTHVSFAGLMMMASNTDNLERVEQDFSRVKKLFDEIKSRETEWNVPSSFSQLSMGMSHDYLLAVKHGSTMVRVGSKIFNVEESGE